MRSAGALRALAALACVVAVASAWPAPAAAHPMRTSAVLLDIGPKAVTGELRLPLDRLAVARGEAIGPAQARGAMRPALEAYVARHVGARGTDGTRWRVDVGRATVQSLGSGETFVVSVAFHPPAGHNVSDFRLTYDVILDRLVTHRVLVSVRTDRRRGSAANHDAKSIGVFDWNHQTLLVPASGAAWLQGTLSSLRLGFEHVSSGADHLLFLLMLLLTAPLVAVRGRWTPGPSGRVSVRRVVHVVSAFAVGHSITLIAAGVGLVAVPERPIEILIALSIAISALHAARPLVARGEVLIAAGFGLVHGLAFASALDALGLTKGSLISSLLGFNLGIEATQLLVVALVMPSLLVLSQTRAYRGLRIGVAAVGFALAVTWMADRAGLIADPTARATGWVIAHPWGIVAAVAMTALGARLADALTRGTPTPVVLTTNHPGGPV